MKVLFDTNVLLDLLLDRAPHADLSEQLVSLVDAGALDGAICATTATTIHYLAAKAVGRKAATGHLRKLLAIFEVAAVDERVLRGALDLQFPDFEDAVLHEAARAVRATAIVTRNGKDFARATLLVFDPPELLAALRAEAE